MKRTKLFSVLLAAAMLLSLCACGKTDAPADNTPVDPQPPVETPQPAPAPVEPTPAPVEPAPVEPTLDAELPINIMSLNGTTGFGMAKLIADSKAGSAALNYEISVETDAANVTAALINGTVDLANPYEYLTIYLADIPVTAYNMKDAKPIKLTEVQTPPYVVYNDSTKTED